MHADPPWMVSARSELGVAAWPEGQCNPRITTYHAGTNIAGYDDKVSWCSSFVHWCLGQAGVAGTGVALARSWLDWGEAIDTPRPGCIVVLWREAPDSWKGHVGFYLRHDAQQVWLLGGNQLGSVCENAYPVECVLAYRWPAAHTAGTSPRSEFAQAPRCWQHRAFRKSDQAYERCADADLRTSGP